MACSVWWLLKRIGGALVFIDVLILGVKITPCQGVFVDISHSDMLNAVKSSLNITQARLSEALGVSVDRIKSLSSGRVAMFSPGEIRALVQNLHVNPVWIATGEGEMFQSANSPPATSSTVPDGFILVPHYEVQASAGNGALVHSEQIVDYLAFKADWVRNTLGVAQKDLALISVKGDSMEPTLSNEDLILVDMRKSRVEDNAIYVLQLDGTLLVKRIQRKLDGTLHVMSDNSRYQPEIVGADRSADLHVLGRVVWSGRRM